MMPLYVVLPGANPEDRLTEAEIDLVFDFAIRVHNHDASTPAQPLYWLRSDVSDIWKFAN